MSLEDVEDNDEKVTVVDPEVKEAFLKLLRTKVAEFISLSGDEIGNLDTKFLSIFGAVIAAGKQLGITDVDCTVSDLNELVAESSLVPYLLLQLPEYAKDVVLDFFAKHGLKQDIIDAIKTPSAPAKVTSDLQTLMQAFTKIGLFYILLSDVARAQYLFLMSQELGEDYDSKPVEALLGLYNYFEFDEHGTFIGAS